MTSFIIMNEGLFITFIFEIAMEIIVFFCRIPGAFYYDSMIGNH